jgi:PAS domain S-box-containing protein
MGPVLRALLCVESDARASWFSDAFEHSGVASHRVFVHNVDDCKRRLRESAWDLLVCDVAEGCAGLLDAAPGYEERGGVPLVIVAGSFGEVALASYRLQGLVCPAGSAVHFLEAVASARSALGSIKGTTVAFECGEREAMEQIARGGPLVATLERIVRLVEGQAQGMLCSILLLDAEQRVVPAAMPSLPPEFSRAIAGYAVGPNEGSCGAAMYRREPVFVRDIATHENWIKYRDLALPAGLRASWSVPILSGDGSVLGAFAMYYAEPRDASEREYSWVARASYLAGIAVLRDRAEQTLSNSEHRYRQIVDTAYEGVWLLDSFALTTFVNARAAELLGYSVEEMLGKSLLDFVDEDDRAAAESYLTRRRQNISEQHELRFRRKDGQKLWALVAASPLTDERGEVVGALGMLTDITRLKRAEATLRANELELRTIFDNAAIGIALVDVEGRSRRSNRALQRMLGYSAEELSEMSFPAFTHPEDVAADSELYARMLAGELKSYQLEKRFLRSDGNVVWGRLTASLVREAASEPVLGVGMVEDISNQKLAEARISAQAALLDQAKDAILVRDRAGVVEYWNKGAERLYGWSSQEAIGRNVIDLLYREPSSFRVAETQLLEHDAWSGEIVQITRAGDEVVVEGSWTLIRDEAGTPKSVLAINTDVTARKHLEAQVFSAQRMESLGTLAGGIAHDFNNILAAILANVSLAADDLSPDHPVQSALAEINEASLRAAALVRQILTFSRRRAPERRVIRLQSVVDEALKLLRATLPASVRIETHFSPTTPEVFADATQVHQVVMNLATNAAHAMSERGGELRLSCERAFIEERREPALAALRPGTYALLIVEDTGSGMDAETLKRIFDPFFTTKGPGEGTGLGLSVVHGVMRAHEGGVAVHSVLGRGSRFDLYFPAARAAAEHHDKRGPTPLRGRGERVLCIDDEAPIVRATSLLLERLGYRVVAHTHPARALQALALNPNAFDAVVSDCAMPLIWGLDFVREIQRLRPSMPIVMTSGLIEPSLEKAFRELGVREFVAKPGSIEDLGAALQRLLAPQRRS